MADFLVLYCGIFLFLFAFPILRIWKTYFLGESKKPVSDRVAWTIFTVGISLMFTMAVYALTREDGSYRTWESIRFHQRCFFGFSIVTIAGPLIVFLWQHAKKPVDREDRDND